jgi:hypothetical protein
LSSIQYILKWESVSKWVYKSLSIQRFWPWHIIRESNWM